MRIVISGGDEVAFRLAEELMAHHDVVLLLPEELRGPRTDIMDVQVVHGASVSSTALRKAGVEDADCFVACSHPDERNLVACVAARRIGAQRTICFLFSRDLRQSVEDDTALAHSLGIDIVVRPAQQLADEIVRIVTVPGALDVEAFAGGRVRLLRHPVEDGSPITKGTLRELGVPDGVVLVMGRRGDQIFIPSGDTQFQAGDKLTAMGSPEGINRLLFRQLRTADHGSEARTATVIGGGAVGISVAQGLEDAGWSVKLIEADAARCEKIAPLIMGLVLHGDGGDLELLEQERVGDDSVLVAVTSNDEKNLLVSLLGKSLGIPRTITRADLHANERLFERVGIDVVKSTRGAAIRSVARSLVHGREELLAELEHGDAEVLELTLPAEVQPISIFKLRQPTFAIIGAILRGGQVIIPRGNDFVQGGDHLIVFCTKEDERAVRTFFLETLSELQD